MDYPELNKDMVKLYDPANGQMRVAGLMSRKGNTLIKLIEYEKELDSIFGKSPYKVVVIFSDNSESKASEIGEAFGIPVIIRDINSYYLSIRHPKTDIEARKKYDKRTVDELRQYNINACIYAGYMSIATAPLVNAFLGINIHNADLTVTENGKRKYRGFGQKCVENAILAGDKAIKSTTHILDEDLDTGHILMVSEPVEVILPKNFDHNDEIIVENAALANQERLKQIGDFVILPKTVEYIALGRYSIDEFENIYFDGVMCTEGVRLNMHQ